MKIEVITIFNNKHIFNLVLEDSLRNEIQRYEELNSTTPIRRSIWYNLILFNIEPYIGIKLKI